MHDSEQHIPAATAPLPVTIPAAAPELVPTTKARTPTEIAWRRFKRHKLAMIGAVVLGIVILLAILAPLISRYSYGHIDLSQALQGPSAKHWFGAVTYMIPPTTTGVTCRRAAFGRVKIHLGPKRPTLALLICARVV